MGTAGLMQVRGKSDLFLHKIFDSLPGAGGAAVLLLLLRAALASSALELGLELLKELLLAFVYLLGDLDLEVDELVSPERERERERRDDISS
jgi:hypothetical protein